MLQTTDLDDSIGSPVNRIYSIDNNRITLQMLIDCVNFYIHMVEGIFKMGQNHAMQLVLGI